jgi:hypothetical protein
MTFAGISGLPSTVASSDHHPRFSTTTLGVFELLQVNGPCLALFAPRNIGWFTFVYDLIIECALILYA